MATKLDRANVMADAIASIRMEGLSVDPAFSDLFEAYVKGRMTADDVRREILARISVHRSSDGAGGCER